MKWSNIFKLGLDSPVIETEVRCLCQGFICCMIVVVTNCKLFNKNSWTKFPKFYGGEWNIVNDFSCFIPFWEGSQKEVAVFSSNQLHKITVTRS